MGRPSRSRAVPGGISVPEAFATVTAPKVVAAGEKSITRGLPFFRGTPRAIGLVPSTAFPPPWGAMRGMQWDMTRPQNPFLAIRRAKNPSMPL